MENCAVLCGINRHLFSFPGEVNLTQILKAIFSGQVNEFSSPFSQFFETWSCYRDLNGLKLGTLPHASQWLELQKSQPVWLSSVNTVRTLNVRNEADCYPPGPADISVIALSNLLLWG